MCTNLIELVVETDDRLYAGYCATVPTPTKYEVPARAKYTLGTNVHLGQMYTWDKCTLGTNDDK